jgi:hypothetical protein
LSNSNGNTDIDSSRENDEKGIKDLITSHLREFLYQDLLSRRSSSDIVSNNAKIVLFGLFALVGFAILLYGLTATNDKFDSWDVKPKKDFWTGNTIEEGTQLQPEEKLIVSQQLEQINSIYIAAIAGALALGGTLISQLWGRK